MSKFVITKRANGEFQFNLVVNNGQTILSSEGYTTKPNCQNGIAAVKTNSPDPLKFDRKTSANGKAYFNLKAANGQIIGTSQMYESIAASDGGIESVRINATVATIDDQTL